MKSEEEDVRVSMTEEELQHWVREQVAKDEQLMQRRAQLVQVEKWVRQKEREAKHTKMLYDSASLSVLECESVIKGLYGMLGQEYRDTDSEEEGAKPLENAVQSIDFDNGDDNCVADGVDDDDYVVIHLGSDVAETVVKEEPKEVELSAGVESSECSIQVVKKEAVDSPVNVKPSTAWKNCPSGKRSATIKTPGSPVPITPPSDCDLPEKESSPPVLPSTSTPMNKSIPSTTVPNTSSTNNRLESPSQTSASTKQNVDTPEQFKTPSQKISTLTVSEKPASKSKSVEAATTSATPSKTTGKERAKQASPNPRSRLSSTITPSSTTGSTKQSVETPTQSSTFPVSEKPDFKSRSSNAATAASGKITAKEKASPSSRPSTTTPSSTTFKAAPVEKAKSNDPKQGETKSQTSSPQSGTSTFDKSTKRTTTTSMKPPDAKEDSQPDRPDPPGSPAVPVRVQQEVQLRVNMSILGRRRTKTWHQGTITDIRTADDSGIRYKVLFDGGKGKSVLSPHHLACVDPPVLKDLFVGCRIVACYKENGQSWLHAAVVAEMPDRKNRMRFLVFFDDGRPAYIALPGLHLVCKTMTNMSDDIEDETWRAELEEYLQTYPNPIFVVMRVGQDCKVERNGEIELCSVTQVDGSLIEVRYQKDEEKEWLYKGSNRLEQVRNIKKRMAKQKEQTGKKAGWVAPQKSTYTPTTTTSSSINSSTTITKNSTTNAPKTATTTTFPKIATTAPATAATTTTPKTTTTTTTFPKTTTTTGPKTTTTTTFPKGATTAPTTAATTITAPKATTTAPETATITSLDYKLATQPRVVLRRIAEPLGLKTEKTTTQADPTVTLSLNKGMKRSTSDEDSKSQSALVPVSEPCLKYVPHRCCPACLNHVRPMQKDQHRGQNPLLIPLLHGFRRMTARRRLDGKMSFHVFYRAPCGRSMCEMEEVQAFLFESRCDFLFLEMFCLDPFVLVKRALLPSSRTSRPYLFLRDISGGKECVPVPCVNEFSTVSPPPLSYTRHRLPAPGVTINTNLDFMVGCDCTDGCRDRSKCSCYQMTMEATSLFSGGPVDVTAGYTHKRLPHYVPTGVYECNPLCRCDPWLCGNRLVQHGLQLRLEVFMTQHKGWGLRCLDDISKGTFVCVFTGTVVKDEMVSSESVVTEMSTNEYLANLDYIEGVEKLKEGYESNAYCSEPEEESDKKTLVTMTTGALKKHDWFLDTNSSSGEEKEETVAQETETKVKPAKRERKVSDTSDEETEEDLDDEDYKVNMDDMGAEWKYMSSDFSRSYATRRNAKIQQKKYIKENVRTSPKISEDQTEVTASMAKKMRKEGPGEPKVGFAKKSTRPFAIKSSHRRVNPEAAGPEKSVQEKRTRQGSKCTRGLFNGEKACYLIDAKQEGNVARFINHSCRPNLFVQNVFVDTHDLRFPWVAFFTCKRIRAGTELTWDYSYEVGSVEGKVVLCCCGSSECTGRLL